MTTDRHLGPMRVMTRQVPASCGACNGFGDKPSSIAPIKCEPCDGKGWLWVTETTTEPAISPIVSMPNPMTLNSYQCSICRLWINHGDQHYCIGYTSSAPS